MTQAYPLAWPAGWLRATSRKRAKFNKKTSTYRAPTYEGGTGYTQTRNSEVSVADGTKRVLDELSRLGVPYGEAIISTNMELRLDGLPRSDRRPPDDPGVAVYWRRSARAEMKVMAIDIYDRVADNLAAVAATLDAMRAIERHGGAQILERAFTGFDALPSPDDWRVTMNFPPGLRPTQGQLEARFRMLSHEAHPDKGGPEGAMSRLTEAREKAKRELGFTA